MKSYSHKNIEKKWQEKWDAADLYHTDDDRGKPKSYVLDMFPYPSGSGLHVGHPKGYIASDIYSRYKHMTGHAILHPMGWDAFGLPAENFAIKNKVHPQKAVEKNIARYKSQLMKLGCNYDWSREINTTDPNYYKWTQWIFLQMFKKGLAYESYEPINWCPSCKTGLANEDLEGNRCERCGSIVEKKPMRQWVLRITDYAERLLDDLHSLNWPESIKESQKNWIGRSEGMLFTAPVKDMDLNIQTFSAHFEAFHADTFVVIAPDHPLLATLIKDTDREQKVLSFAQDIIDERNKRGFEEEKEPKGIFTGRYIVDPVGNGELPIWVASFALSHYGTGIVKCSAHDERDFAFAKKYDIPLKTVLYPNDPDERKRVENFEYCYSNMKEGFLSEPKEFNGKKCREVREKIINHLVKNNIAERSISYRLRDWVFSRQRYWGEPIPIIHCEACGIVPVPEDQLPVVLPEVDSYEPTGTGESPLAKIDNWVHVKCPTCSGKAKRETNTMPQWAGSSWYYLRYIDPHNNDTLADKAKEQYWSPVDMYIGGAEHATRHLIYARFWHKFLFDIGSVNYPEPFNRLQHVGLINAEDGRKMSKRYGNVINPDDIVDLYGADTLRVYEMFMGPFDQTIAWNTKSIIGSRRFLEKVWRFSEKVERENKNINGENHDNLESHLHKTIKKVGDDIEKLRFNTAISQLMIFTNAMEKTESIPRDIYERFIILLAPFAPYIAEEIWHNLGNESFIYLEGWPMFEEKKIVSDVVTIAIQINGKLRDTCDVPADISEEEIREIAIKRKKIKEHISNGRVDKTFYVPGRLLNIVVKADS